MAAGSARTFPIQRCWICTAALTAALCSDAWARNLVDPAPVRKTLLSRSDAGSRLGGRDRAQVFVYRAQVPVGHVAENRPGHDLKDAVAFIRIVPGAHQMFEFGQRVTLLG